MLSGEFGRLTERAFRQIATERVLRSARSCNPQGRRLPPLNVSNPAMRADQLRLDTGIRSGAWGR